MTRSESSPSTSPNKITHSDVVSPLICKIDIMHGASSVGLRRNAPTIALGNRILHVLIKLRCKSSTFAVVHPKIPSSAAGAGWCSHFFSRSLHKDPSSLRHGTTTFSKRKSRTRLIQLLTKRRSRAICHGNISRFHANHNLYLANDFQHTPCSQA